jgi:hypothetical protein
MGRAPEAGARSRGSTSALVTGAAVLLVTITWVDYVTGYEFGFFVFYFLPVALTAWYAGRRWGIAFGVAGAVCWYVSDRLGGHPYSRAWFVYWETFMRLVSFVTTAVTLAQIREALARERRLVAELSASLAQVRQLEGLIPVCAYCRRIRDDAGYWDRFEAYLASRTGATFSHGICPTCFDRLEHEDGGLAGRMG